mmetsp:Transcript_535/g.1174  ORF Transcript_535/g.1174 Transcript_535/m.1174 type:complete len:196 (-) Transcript_535:657-1244(-)
MGGEAGAPLAVSVDEGRIVGTSGLSRDGILGCRGCFHGRGDRRLDRRLGLLRPLPIAAHPTRVNAKVFYEQRAAIAVHPLCNSARPKLATKVSHVLPLPRAKVGSSTQPSAGLGGAAVTAGVAAPAWEVQTPQEQVQQASRPPAWPPASPPQARPSSPAIPATLACSPTCYRRTLNSSSGKSASPIPLPSHAASK